VRAIGEELERAKAQPAPKKFAELVALVYEHAIQAGAVDPGYVRKLIRLL
jgi:hypothetical protein